MAKQKTKPKRKNTGVGCIALVVVAILVALAAQNAQKRERSAIAVSRPTTEPLATQTVRPTRDSATQTAIPATASPQPTTADDDTMATFMARQTSAPGLPTSAPQQAAPEIPPAFDEAAYVSDLTNGLAIVAGGRDIASIRVADGRANGGERVVIVAYTTTETTEAGYLDEVMDLYSGIAATMAAHDLDVDSVSLVAGNAAGQAAGILVADAAALMAYHRGEMTRAAFLEQVEVAPLAGSASSGQDSTAQPSCPRHCFLAVALGWTAAEAGQCANLDRDGDGAACYGD